MKRSSLFPLLLVSILGSFSPGWAAPSKWEAVIEEQQFGQPDGIEVQAQGGGEAFRSNAPTTAVTVVPDPAGSSRMVIALRDTSDPAEKEGAAIAKGGFNAAKARLAFQFYTRSPQRNGNLLVRLLNREGKVVASFQLYAKGREKGELQLNTFAPESDRRAPAETGLYDEKTWTPVTLNYDGIALKWSLSIGNKEFTDIPVDVNLADTKVGRFEIYTGFGAATKTLLYIDNLSFETLN